MKRILLAASAMTLAACTGPQNYGPQGQSSYAQSSLYAPAAQQSAHHGNCMHGGCYSVAPAHKPGYGAHAAHQGHYQGHAQAPHAPQTINAPRAAYGTAAAGALSALRGTAQPRRGYKYGELGGVAYDPFDDTYGVQGRVGYQSANYWGVEAEGSLGLTDRTEVVAVADPLSPTGFTDVSVEAGIKHSLAGFGRLAYPVTPRLSLVSRVGYHTTTLEGEAGGVQADVDIDGFAYGGGMEYSLSPRSALRLDYTNYDGGNDASGTLDSLALGYQVRF